MSRLLTYRSSFQDQTYLNTNSSQKKQHFLTNFFACYIHCLFHTLPVYGYKYNTVSGPRKSIRGCLQHVRCQFYSRMNLNLFCYNLLFAYVMLEMRCSLFQSEVILYSGLKFHFQFYAVSLISISDDILYTFLFTKSQTLNWIKAFFLVVANCPLFVHV